MPELTIFYLGDVFTLTAAVAFLNLAEFSVKRRENYKQWRKKEFSVEEVGRHNYESLVDLETWSKESGNPVPESCQSPFVYPPKSLPVSLKLNRWVEHSHIRFRDIDYDHLPDFEVELPPKEIPEFIPEFFSVGKILSWAMREEVDLEHVDMFILSCALRDIASIATLGRWIGNWEYAVFCYKGKIFIDRTVGSSERYWKEGLNDPVSYDHWKLLKEPPSEPLVRKKADSETEYEFIGLIVPYFDYSVAKKMMWAPIKYGKKFEDVLRSGGPGNPRYNGVDKRLRMAKCNKLIDLSGLKIMTATRLSCQEPKGLIDTPENMVEMKTTVHHSKEKFAKFKALSLWIHCALVGIDSVYCGFRTKDGQLTDVKKYTMTELAELGKDYWSPNEILVFLDTVLSWLKEKLNKDAVRNKKEDDWLKDELKCEDGASFTLSYSGDERIRLEKGDHPELKKIVTERYNHVVQQNVMTGCSEDVPDNWDD